MTRYLAVALVGASLFLVGGCAKKLATVIDKSEDVNKELPPGEFGLEKLDPKDYPDMRQAWADRSGLERAIDKSLQYMNSPSSKRFFPSGPKDPITHAQVLASLQDIKRMLRDPSVTPERFQQEVLARYDVWASRGYNWDTKPAGVPGDVWFTAYYTPIYRGSRTPTAQYRYPVYARPADLVSDPITGEVHGQRMPDGSMRPYPTRAELTQSGVLRGTEIMWFADPMEPYIIQVQGSAKVILPDNQVVYLGYAGKNGRNYYGLGKQLLDRKVLTPKQISLPAVLDYFKQHPDELPEALAKNESFVFLKEYDAKEWPSGSLGVQVTPTRSLATDKTVFPRAALTFITVDMPTVDGGMAPARRFLLDQDTGGAIRAAGRADIYLGIGDLAGQMAGRQFAQGQLYYLVLKPAAPAGSGGFPALTPRSPGGAGSCEIFPGAKPQ